MQVVQVVQVVGAARRCSERADVCRRDAWRGGAGDPPDEDINLCFRSRYEASRARSRRPTSSSASASRPPPHRNPTPLVGTARASCEPVNLFARLRSMLVIGYTPGHATPRNPTPAHHYPTTPRSSLSALGGPCSHALTHVSLQAGNASPKWNK